MHASGTDVFQWILRNLWEHLFYRTPPGDCIWKLWNRLCNSMLKKAEHKIIWSYLVIQYLVKEIYIYKGGAKIVPSHFLSRPTSHTNIPLVVDGFIDLKFSKFTNLLMFTNLSFFNLLTKRLAQWKQIENILSFKFISTYPILSQCSISIPPDVFRGYGNKTLPWNNVLAVF